MKKSQSSVGSAIILFLLLFVIGCGVDTNEKEACPCDCEEPDETYSNGIIFPQEARQLYINYENRRVNLIQEYEDAIDEEKGDIKQQGQQEQNNADGDNVDPNGPKFDVARYVYYDYDDLKKYMAYIENEAKLSGEKLSTLRFYFANYPDEDKFPDGESVVHRRQNSIMMSPTIQREGKENIFYTVDAEEGKRRAVVLANDFQRKNTDGMEGQEEADPKNEASLVPAFLSLPNAAPIFADRSTTKNEGSSAPPPY